MRLTDRVIKSLPAPAAGAKITYDGELPGFGIRVTSKGVRSFVLNYIVAGHERRLTIGRFPTWSTTAAREQARQLKRQVDAGVDPLTRQADEAARAAAERALPTVHDLFERYAAEPCRVRRPGQRRTTAVCGSKSSCHAWAISRSETSPTKPSTRSMPRSRGRVQ